jgi:excisionase family DNA binding protein
LATVSDQAFENNTTSQTSNQVNFTTMHKCQVKPGPEEKFYSVEAAASYLTIGTTTVYKASQQRQLKHTRFGKSSRIMHHHFMAWVRDQTMPTLKEISARDRSRAKHRQRAVKVRRGRPPLWPPRTIDDYRKLAKHIEQKISKEEGPV